MAAPFRLQADAASRMRLSDAFKLYVRNKDGGMVPLATFADFEFFVGTDNATRYNLYNTIQLNGSTGAGFGSGDAIKAVQEVAAQVLPDGVDRPWNVHGGARDGEAGFHVDALPSGTTVIEYLIRPELVGRFTALPTSAFGMYDRTLMTRGAEQVLRVGDR